MGCVGMRDSEIFFTLTCLNQWLTDGSQFGVPGSGSSVRGLPGSWIDGLLAGSMVEATEGTEGSVAEPGLCVMSGPCPWQAGAFGHDVSAVGWFSCEMLLPVVSGPCGSEFRAPG